MRCPRCEGSGEFEIYNSGMDSTACLLCKGTGTVSAFSPEAVQAAAAEAKHLLRTRPVRGFSASFSTTEFAEEIADAALAAAWATDFGGDGA